MVETPRPPARSAQTRPQAPVPSLRPAPPRTAPASLPSPCPFPAALLSSVPSFPPRVPTSRLPAAVKWAANTGSPHSDFGDAGLLPVMSLCGLLHGGRLQRQERAQETRGLGRWVAAHTAVTRGALRSTGPATAPHRALTAHARGNRWGGGGSGAASSHQVPAPVSPIAVPDTLNRYSSY